MGDLWLPYPGNGPSPILMIFLKTHWISNGHFWIQDCPNPSQCQLQSITKHWQISRHISQKSAQYYRISPSPKIDNIIAKRRKSPLELGSDQLQISFPWRMALTSGIGFPSYARISVQHRSMVTAMDFTAMICICKDTGTDLTWLDYTDLTYDLTT